MASRARTLGRAFLLAAALAATGARADNDDAPAGPTQRPQDRSALTNAARATGADEIEGPTILEGVPAFNRLDELRDILRDRYGIYFHGQYLGEPYADVAGGLQRGGTYAGRLDVQVDVDAAKVAGIDGGTLHANMFQIHGLDISKEFIGNLLSSNDIAGFPTTRLYELWYEQKLGDKVSVRAGQIGIDVEFLTSDYAANFVDATFGWPGLPSLDLPQGGPAYPLATPAVRVKISPTDDLAILAAVFDGDPAGPGVGNPQARDPYGLNFRLSDPPLVFVESQYRYNHAPQAAGLPGTLKLGAFAHFGHFADQAIGTDGLPLALGNGLPVQHSPNVGVYGILDQQVYRKPGDDPAKGVGVFARVIGAPGDRNIVDLYADAGFSAFGLVPGRPDDQFGVAAAFARLLPVQQSDDLADLASSVPGSARSFEAVIEATYQALVIPGLTLQPTLQYVIHPRGGTADPSGYGITPIHDALVLGVSLSLRL